MYRGFQPPGPSPKPQVTLQKRFFIIIIIITKHVLCLQLMHLLPTERKFDVVVVVVVVVVGDCVSADLTAYNLTTVPRIKTLIGSHYLASQTLQPYR